MISSIYFTPYSNVSTLNAKKTSFKGNCFVETIKHTNIGNCLEGYIGKVRVRKGANNQETFLNVFKRYLDHNIENYAIKDDMDRLVGEVDVAIKKYEPAMYDWTRGLEDPSHVFVDNLKNYSNPNTPYYNKELEHYKDVGTRLLQIAQRRSDEAQCVGNIKLITVPQSKNWYKSVIGMTEEFPPMPNVKFNIHNPNAMILPAHSKEPLSRLQGGL